MKIAFQGQRGSYTEAAAAWMFGDEDIATVPRNNARGVFEALEAGDCQVGVVRLENSEWGTSFEILDLLRATECYFVRDIRFHEQYNLAGQSGATEDSIHRIYAHPAILNLCGDYLSGLQGTELLARYDSAESLAALVQRGDKDEATVCSDFAADIFGLKVLHPGIENSVTGVTRFVALSYEKFAPSDGSRCSTTVMFELKHEPGALMNALAAFRGREINLSSVFARPNKGTRWDYTVFVEFPGSFEDRKNRDALEDLRRHTTYLQLVGSYETIEPKFATT